MATFSTVVLIVVTCLGGLLGLAGVVALLRGAHQDGRAEVARDDRSRRDDASRRDSTPLSNQE